MLEDRESYRPLVLFEYDHEPGSYCLMLSDGDMLEVMDVFEAGGRYGNGYAWSDVALQAMRAGAPDLERRVSMDPEAGTFVASGRDLEALRALGALLHAAFHDRERLRALVTAAPFEWD